MKSRDGKDLRALSVRELTALTALTALLALGTALAWPGWLRDKPEIRLVPSSALHVGSPDSLLLTDNTAYVNLNAATMDELTLLPGIGPVRAKAIIEDRQSRGPFPSVDALHRVRGIGPKTVERLRPFLIVSDETRR